MATITKTLIILANSVRRDPERCVAGREVIQNGGGFGDWIRPVSRHGDGEISLKERTLSDGKEVSVLDIVRVFLVEKQVDALQPENWIIDSDKKWERIGTAKKADLDKLAEKPKNLWDEPRARLDSVSVEHVNRNPLKQSLLLVRLESLLLRFSTEQYQLVRRKRRRAEFIYNGTAYDLGITDPTIEERYGVRIPGLDKPDVVVELKAPCFVCVSLTHQPLRERHYKLVAAIIDPNKQ